jgi:hypothetical protein
VEPDYDFIEGSNPSLSSLTKGGNKPPFVKLAEREGFEPSMGFCPIRP